MVSSTRFVEPFWISNIWWLYSIIHGCTPMSVECIKDSFFGPRNLCWRPHLCRLNHPFFGWKTIKHLLTLVKTSESHGVPPVTSSDRPSPDSAIMEPVWGEAWHLYTKYIQLLVCILYIYTGMYKYIYLSIYIYVYTWDPIYFIQVELDRWYIML